MAAASGQRDLHGVRGRGDGTDARADGADVETRFAVRGQDPGQALQHTLADDGEGSAGQALLCGLEDDPDAAGEGDVVVGAVDLTGLAGHQTVDGDGGAGHDRGVHVMSAGVGHALGGGGVVQTGALGQGQGVDVRPQTQHQRSLADVHVRTGVLQLDRAQSVVGEQLEDPLGGAVLLVGELGMLVQIPAEGHQIRLQ